MKENIDNILIDLVKNLNNGKIKLCEDAAILENLENNIFLDIKTKYKKILIVAIGASLSNIRSILSSTRKENYLFDVDFLDSIDKETVDFKLKTLTQDTKIIFISNSGNTAEIVILYKYLREYAKSILRINFDPLLFCSNENSELCQLINSDFTDINSKILKCSDNITTSGRFGAFSFCNLFVAKLVGVDVEKFLNNAIEYIQQLQNCDLEIFKNLSSEIHFIMENYYGNRKIFVNFYYSDRLEGLMFWAKQIISESLGKDGFGITYIPSRGTEDQHSQLELFLGGCDDKFFKIYLKSDEEIKEEIKEESDEDYKEKEDKNNDMQTMFRAQGENVYNSLIKFNKNAKITRFKNIDESFISKNMIDLYIITIAIANLVGINPFNQPMVEEIKKWIKKQTI
jgi:glucose-6-phosphate isomerase